MVALLLRKYPGYLCFEENIKNPGYTVGRFIAFLQKIVAKSEFFLQLGSGNICLPHPALQKAPISIFCIFYYQVNLVLFC